MGFQLNAVAWISELSDTVEFKDYSNMSSHPTLDPLPNPILGVPNDHDFPTTTLALPSHLIQEPPDQNISECDFADDDTIAIQSSQQPPSSSSVIHCPCCNVPMTLDHTCSMSDDTASDDTRRSFLSDEDSAQDSDDIRSSEVYVPRKVNVPQYTSDGNPMDTCDTFCILAGFDTYDKVGHSAVLYYKCSEYTRYICHVCKMRIDNHLLGPPCCQNFNLESIPYSGSLVPKW